MTWTAARVPDDDRLNTSNTSNTRFDFQRLKAAVHYTVGRMCHLLGEEYQREFGRQVVAAIAETAVRQCGNISINSTFGTLCWPFKVLFSGTKRLILNCVLFVFIVIC